jgi:hypothetical protein
MQSRIADRAILLVNRQAVFGCISFEKGLISNLWLRQVEEFDLTPSPNSRLVLAVES